MISYCCDYLHYSRPIPRDKALGKGNTNTKAYHEIWDWRYV